MKIAGVWAVLVCLGPVELSGARGEFATPVAITHARIVVGPGKVIDAGTVVIDGRRIVAVGQNVAVPADAEIVDASGLIVYPGFIDANTHAGITRGEPGADERSRVEDETPDVREGPHSATLQAYRRLMHPRWRAEEVFDPKAAKAEAFRKAGFTTALVSPKPAIFSGQSAVIELGDAPLRRSVVRAEMAQHVAFVTSATPEGGEESSRDQHRYPVTIMGAVAGFRQMLLDAKWHDELAAWGKRHPEADPPALDRDLQALRKLSGGKQPVVFTANSENEIHRALDMAQEFGLRAIIAGGGEAWKVAERLKRDQVPVILSLKWPEEPKAKKEQKKKDKDENNADKQTKFAKPDEQQERHALEPLFDDQWEEQTWEPARLFEERKRLWAEKVDNAKRLAEAGVRFAIGSFEMKSAAEAIEHLREAIERGLPEEAAVAALTVNAAELLGVADQMGRIAPGQLANLTVLTRPLADKKAKTQWVFVEGKRFDVDVAGEEEKDDKDKDKEGEAGSAEAVSRPASKPAPTTAAASRPAEAPIYAVEIEADRKPTVQTDGNLLIRNATLLTITQGIKQRTDLLIRNGKVARIGKKLAAPPGVLTIDLVGYCVMPGIIEPHSHICIEGKLNESSVSVSCEVRLRDVINPHDVAAYRALAGGVTTIHTMHGSANTIGGQNVVLRLKYGRPGAQWVFREAPQTVKFAMGENVKQSNWGKRGTRFPNTRMGVEAVMRRAFDAAKEYEQEQKAYTEATVAGNDPRPVRRDLRLETLVTILDGKMWVHCHCYRADEILRLLAVAEEAGFRIGVLQHVLESYRVIPEIRRHGCGASTFSDWWAYKIEAYDAIPHNAARMVQGGVVATVNSDSPELVRHLNLEAAKSLRFGGLSADEALRLVTLHGAMQLGIAEFVGAIEVGKHADLAVLNGHPLDTYSRCLLTLIDGEVYFQDASFDVSQPPPALAGKTFAVAARPRKVEASAGGAYWIVGGTIYPVSGPPIENGLLTISNGKIGRVGRWDGRRAPAGVTVVDAKGLRVYPGLINAGTSLGLTEIRSVAGTMDVSDVGEFQPDLLALSAYNPFASAIEVTRAEGVTSALIIPGGGAVAGRAGLVHLDGWSMAEAKIASPIGLVVHLPVLPARFPDELPEEKRKERRKEHREKMAKVESFFRKAKHYAEVRARAKEDPKLKPEYDRKLEAMIPAMRREVPVLFRADAYKEIREAVRFAEHYGLRPVILGGREAWKAAAELAAKKVDVIVGRSMAYPGGKHEPWDSVYRNAAVLAEAGVRFCFATGGYSLAKNLGIEAGMAVAHGLDRQRALEAITIEAARILGVSDRLGSLEAGKTADVIVTTDEPMQASNRVVLSFIGGRPVDLSNKHTQLDEKFLTRPAPALPAAPALRGPPALRLPVAERP